MHQALPRASCGSLSSHQCRPYPIPSHRGASEPRDIRDPSLGLDLNSLHLVNGRGPPHPALLCASCRRRQPGVQHVQVPLLRDPQARSAGAPGLCCDPALGWPLGAKCPGARDRGRPALCPQGACAVDPRSGTQGSSGLVCGRKAAPKAGDSTQGPRHLQRPLRSQGPPTLGPHHCRGWGQEGQRQAQPPQRRSSRSGGVATRKQEGPAGFLHPLSQDAKMSAMC